MSSAQQNGSGPVWEIAGLFPDQGKWKESDYLKLSRSTNCLVEFADGCVEVLIMPTKTHQRVVLYVYNALLAFVVNGKLGEVLVAPYPVKLRQGKFREPDILFVSMDHRKRMREEYADGADLVVEVVGYENRTHDLVTKRGEYAEAGIPEYWIVDQRDRKIIVLTLREGRYDVHVESSPGQMIDSVLLPGLKVDVAAVFRAAMDGA